MKINDLDSQFDKEDMLLELDSFGQIVRGDDYGICKRAYLRTNLKERLIWLNDELTKNETEFKAASKSDEKDLTFESIEPKKKIRADFKKDNPVLSVGGKVMKLISLKQKRHVYKILKAVTSDLILIDELLNDAKSESDLISQIERIFDLQKNVLPNLTYFSADEFEEILKTEIEKLKKSNSMEEKKPIVREKLRWTGSSIELITMFYDMLDNGLIKGTKKDVERLIINGFTDKNGEDFKSGYIQNELKPEGKRAKNRVYFDELLKKKV